jgi:Phosphotransferase enzyme family
VSTSSIAAPDLGAICRSALGRGAVASEPIGRGGNSRVFRVELDDDVPSFSGSRHVVVKFYRRDPGDARDRLSTEFRSLQFLWQNTIRSIPVPIALARDRGCAIYGYIEGEAATSTAPAAADIDAAVEFLRVLEQLRGASGAGDLPPASEACFSLREIVASVQRRLDRLLLASAAGDDGEKVRGWIDGTFAPLQAEVFAWCRDAAVGSGIAFEAALDQRARTLSPSDFGFHNAVRRPDGTLAFVDFEYFGWDDPAKTIADYLLHPGMSVADTLKRRFAAGVEAAFADVPGLAARARIVYPLFGLKWALILLNDFLPERFSRSTNERRARQLGKAQALVRRLAGEYRNNPFLS